jgi:hypothetical protein
LDETSSHWWETRIGKRDQMYGVAINQLKSALKAIA